MKYQQIATEGVDGALLALSSRMGGLTEAEVADRSRMYGKNTISTKGVTWYGVLLRQFKSAFIYLLLVAAFIAYFFSDSDSHLDAYLILFFLFLNASLGFFQEYRAERSLLLLKNFIERTTHVRRSGRDLTVSVSDIVPGDVVVLNAGDMIPADGYFIRAENVTVDESPLTGETAPVPKHAGPLAEGPKDIYSAHNIAFTRTTLLSGDAEIVIIGIGKDTEVGVIAEAMDRAESPSAFEEGINKFSSFILKMVLFTIPFVFGLNMFVHHDNMQLSEFLIFSIALTVSVIPEALPLVTTLSLSRGAVNLAKKHVVPRRLSAIEDLGSITVLCTDKTGTITENSLSVADVFGERSEVLRYALMGPLSSKEVVNEQNSVFDKALLSLGGIDKSVSYARIDELPFDPVRKKDSVLVDVAGVRHLVTRGAPESVLEDEYRYQEALQWASGEGAKGRRVLAIAMKTVDPVVMTTIDPGDEHAMNVIGLISFADPLKPSARGAVLEARELGVRVKIITGDSREVAGWVGYEAGILTDPTHVLSGDAFLRMSSDERAIAVETYDVFARTTPTAKYEIIATLKNKNLVGFLGEGFNDAPALKIAHVGLAVENASDIAQDASDVILLNRSLHVIIDGIKEGRKIFANSMKYLKATLASNFGNFYALALSSLFIPYLPMLPVQILLLNLLSDFPMISIATDNVDAKELEQPRGYLVAEITGIAIVLGIISTIDDFAFFGYFVQFNDPAVLQTMWFMGSILTELVLLFSIRTQLPFWKSSRPSTLVFLLTIGAALITLVIPFIPWAERALGFARPEPGHMIVLGILVGVYFIASELMKLLFYRYWNARETRRSQSL